MMKSHEAPIFRSGHRAELELTTTERIRGNHSALLRPHGRRETSDVLAF
ncbi:MAG: hypothetical protein ACM3ZE_11270 [Myxococcales bacterium]